MKIQVVIDNQTYTVEVEDIHSRPVIASVQGERFEVWPEDAGAGGVAPFAAPVVSVPDSGPVSSALDAPADTSVGRDVVSPLPGVIVAILVKPGEDVTRGRELCTLEAMKMKNAIRAYRDGTIASIEVSIGDQVGHGQVLITYAE
jgi:glutaconyl-CoA/methylmalonyl-CoA decarboxylase subunit gamma